MVQSTKRAATQLLRRLDKGEVVVVDVVAVIVNGRLPRFLREIAQLTVLVMEAPRITDGRVRRTVVVVHRQKVLALVRALFELGGVGRE